MINCKCSREERGKLVVKRKGVRKCFVVEYPVICCTQRHSKLAKLILGVGFGKTWFQISVQIKHQSSSEIWTYRCRNRVLGQLWLLLHDPRLLRSRRKCTSLAEKEIIPQNPTLKVLSLRNFKSLVYKQLGPVTLKCPHRYDRLGDGANGTI